MGQRIKLTYTFDKKEFEEECFLLEETDRVYTKDGVELPNALSFLFKANLVYFEDENGLFVLRPNQIINIERLE